LRPCRSSPWRWTTWGRGPFPQDTFTVNKDGDPNPVTQTITLTGTWDDTPAPEWDIDNGFIVQTGAGVTINAADLNTGGHFLTATVYKNGVLTITLPKAAEARAHQITVKAQ
jgi:hypothetical protein